MQRTLLVHGKTRHPHFQEVLNLINSLSDEKDHFPVCIEVVDNAVLGSAGFADKARSYINQYERIIVDLSYSDRLPNDSRNPRLDLLLCLRDESLKRGKENNVMAYVSTVLDEAPHQAIMREALQTVYRVPVFLYVDMQGLEKLLVTC